MTTAIYFNEMLTQRNARDNSERRKVAQATKMTKLQQLTKNKT